jgi:hypothetical protein
VKKGNSKEFVFFKYSTNDGMIDNDNEKEEQSSSSLSEEPESQDLLLKEIELLFENGYFYKENKSKINFLFTQVLEERYKRDPTLEVQKDIDNYKCRQDQIDIIEKRRKLRKTVKKNKKCDKRSQHDSDVRGYKRFNTMQDFDSALNDEIEQSEKRFKRDYSDDTEDEEELVIIEHRADPLTVINTPIQDSVAPAATQPVVKHRRILCDDD